MNAVTQLSETGFLAIVEAKFCTIVLVGERPWLVSCSIYSTGSYSCWGLSVCWAEYPSLFERVTPLHLRDSVERVTPCLVAISWRVKSSPASRDSKSAIASSIGALVVELSRVEVEVLRRCFGVRRAQASSVHEGHGHGTLTKVL
jgi:hypothetical protein